MKNTVIGAMLVMTLVLLTAGAQTTGQANLRNPSSLRETAPGIYKVKFETSKGEFVIEVHRDWAPNGADRFFNLVKNGFYDDARFFRVIAGFMVQFGLNGNPEIQSQWTNQRIPPDPVMHDNARGTISFAMAGTPDSRTTQVFINFAANGALNRQGFAPFGRVISGMDVVDNIYSAYGEGPNQQQIRTQGNAYLNQDFPRLDFIRKATIEN